MAPVVTVSFTADVECGVSPLTVNFTNTTTLDAGYQREWLWEFGDGEISESENPSHVYTGSPGQTYDVTLTVLATDGAATAITSNVWNPGLVSHTRLYGTDTTPALAWAARASSPLANKNAEHTLNFNGALYAYTTAIPILTLFSTSTVPAIVKIQTKVYIGIANIIGSININGYSITPTTTNVWHTMGILKDVVWPTGKNVTAEILPQVELPTPPVQQWGNDATFQTRTYPPTATQDYGDATETDFISLAVVPVALFTALPSAGASPLSVQFTNTSIEGCNTSPTYSWKRRITGSGDAFVEFSTSENPLTSFTKS